MRTRVLQLTLLAIAAASAAAWLFPAVTAGMTGGALAESIVLRGAGWLLAAALAGLIAVSITAGRMRPAMIALVLSVALVGWLASRPIEQLVRGTAPSAAEPVAGSAPAAPVRTPVRVVLSVAAAVRPELVANGRTEPARKVTMRAEIGGLVEAVPVAEGAMVEAGQVLVQLAPRDRPARLREAQARLDQRTREYEAARRLGAKQFQSEVRVSETLAELESTRAMVVAMQLDLDQTTIRAPFEGVLERRPVEVGDYVEPGDEVAHLIEQDPYLVVGDAPETERARYRIGARGTAHLADGRSVDGTIRYVATESDGSTRTYRVELEVANPNQRFPAGMSARIVVGEEPQAAHHVSAAALVLDDSGRVGIKIVDDGGVVRFEPARIIRAEADAVWLAGLPERVRLVTVGQGFVAAGQEVDATVIEGDGA